MQDFSVESKTFGISSSSISLQDLEARYKSSNKVNMTPWSPGTKPMKMKNSEDPVRKLLNLVGQGASSIPRRNWRQGPTCRLGKTLEDSGTDTGRRRALAGPKWAQAGKPSLFRGRVNPPFDLAAIRAIYSPEARSHRGTHSSSAPEEQRSERHHLGEKRVELVD
jgi:hypothetical protein